MLNCSIAKKSLVFFCGILTQIIEWFCVVIITQGGGVAAPVGGQIFSEILPYLEVNQGNEEEIEQVEEIEVPDLIGKTIEEALKIAKENEVELVIENQIEELEPQTTKVNEQVPKAGIRIKKGSKIYIKIWQFEYINLLKY